MQNISGLLKPYFGLFASIFLTLVYLFLLQGHSFGLGFTILNLLFIVLLCVIKPNILKSKESLVYLGFSLVISAFIPLRTFWLGNILSFFAVFLLNSLAVSRANAESFSLTLKDLFWFPIKILFLTLTQLGFWIEKIYNNVKIAKKEKGGSLGLFFYALIISLPLLLIFGYLFYLADPIFENYVTHLFPKFQVNIAFEQLFRLLELLFVFSIFSSLFRSREEKYSDFTAFKIRQIDQNALAIATSLVCILFAAFIIVQLQFILAGNQLLDTLKISLSDYTRRGFLELLIITSLSLIIIGFLIKEKTDEVKSKIIKIISLVFIFEVFLLLLSALKRVYMYQDKFGFTQARLEGFIFLLWLLFTLIAVTLLIFKRFNPKYLISFLLINFCVVLLIMQFINIDYLVGVVKKPNLGYGIDYKYISNLSTDAWKSWDSVLENLETKNVVCTPDGYQTLQKMISTHEDLKKKSKNNWNNFGSYKVSNAEALNYLNKNEVRIKKITNRLDRCFQKS